MLHRLVNERVARVGPPKARLTCMITMHALAYESQCLCFKESPFQMDRPREKDTPVLGQGGEKPEVLK
jgi:hypothetical protein